MLERGALILAGSTPNTDDRCFGIVVFEAATEPAARRVMDGDAAVKGGVMHAELYPYHVARQREPALQSGCTSEDGGKGRGARAPTTG